MAAQNNVNTAPANGTGNQAPAVPKPPKTVFEDTLKVIIAIILFLLCVAFFAGLAWLLIVELDAKYVINMSASLPQNEVLTGTGLCGILYK